MSDSGFSGLPPGPRTGNTSFPQRIIELKAKIIELRGEIRAERVRQKLEGEILRHNPDGTTRIKTDKGEITVELRGRDIPPEGTRVEIEIPPGNDPRQAIVRPVAAEQPQRPPETQQQTPPQTEIRADRPATPRLDVRTAEDLARQVAATPPDQRTEAPLRPDDIIRLLPLPPAQVQDIIRPALETIQARITQLPPLPQIALPAAAYEGISPLLTLPRVEHAQLQYNLPQQLPLLTQQTQEPVPRAYLETLPVQARTPVQQLVQYILQANQPAQNAPYVIEPQPVLIAPPSIISSESPPLLPSPLQNITIQQTPSIPIQTTVFNTPITAATAANNIQNNNVFDVRVQTITPPQIRLIDGTIQTSAAQATQINPTILSASAGSVMGEVVGITPQNLPVLSFFPAGFEIPQHFVMTFQASNLPAGTQLQVTPQPGTTASMQTTTAAPFIPFAFFSDFSWPAMQELNQALQSVPQTAQLLSNVTPNPAAPNRLPVVALFFIAAVRSGDISNWLGDKTIDTLRRLGKSDLLSRLSRDVSGLQRTAAEPAGEWRATSLPMMWDGEVHKMMLYYRHDQDHDNDNEENNKGTRFVFDLNLNRMGDVQLDGLHRPGKLDLIVRTEKTFSQDMQKTMRRSYIEALEQTELKGELSFQNKPEQFIKIEMPREEKGITA